MGTNRYWLKLGQPIPSTILGLMFYFLGACGQQDPAFKETRTETDNSSADARVRATGGADSGAADSGSGHDGVDSGMADAGSGGADGGGADAGGSDGTAGNDAGGSDSGQDGGVGGADSGDAGGNDGGLGFTQRTVELTQGGPGKVDILWVVDNSGSMAEEQQYLATNFNAMISSLSSAGHDFQTAVTTTDVCQDSIPSDLSQRVCPVDYGGTPATHLRGTFAGEAGHKVLHKGDADLVSRFNEYTHAGVDGSGFELGLTAAKMAIEKSLNGQNEALVRPDAFLAVIVVSDEQDDGIGLSQVDAYNGHNFVAEGLTTYKFTEDDMIGYLQGAKGAGKFSISTIAPTRNADGTLCTAPHSQPLEEGTQYIQAAKKSGGIVQSICDTNWSASLAKIGLDLSSQITQVALPSHPDVATIKLRLNGVVTTQWTYNAGNNAVKFNAGHAPVEGDVIKVTYSEVP